MKYTMQDFKTQKIACMPANEDEQSRFLQECGKSGLTWRDGDGVPRWYIGQTIACGFCGGTKACGVDKKRYSHAHDAHKNEGWEIVPFASFDFAQPEPEQPAPVTSAHAPIWAGIVTEEMTSQQVNAMLDELRKVRYAKRQAEKPAEDNPAQPEQQYREVERKAKAGDTIKLLSKPGCAEDRTTVGKEYTVLRADYKHAYFNGDNGKHVTCMHERYVVLDPIPAAPATPQEYVEVKRKARVGEKIKVAKTICSVGLYKKGDVLTVTLVHGDDSGVMADGPINKNCPLYHAEYAVLVPVRREKRRANVGEWVEVINARCANDYKNGDVYKVELSRSTGDVEFTDSIGESNAMWHDEYTVLVGFTDADAPEAK